MIWEHREKIAFEIIGIHIQERDKDEALIQCCIKHKTNVN